MSELIQRDHTHDTRFVRLELRYRMSQYLSDGVATLLSHEALEQRTRESHDARLKFRLYPQMRVNRHNYGAVEQRFGQLTRGLMAGGQLFVPTDFTADQLFNDNDPGDFLLLIRPHFADVQQRQLEHTTDEFRGYFATTEVLDKRLGPGSLYFAIKSSELSHENSDMDDVYVALDSLRSAVKRPGRHDYVIEPRPHIKTYQ